MHVLVTVASRAGATLEIAEAVAARLRHHGFAVTVATPDGVADLEPYGGVIVGSAVYRGRWLAGARDFVTRHRDALGRRPVWLFSSGPVGDSKGRLGRAMAVDPVDLPTLLEQTNARDQEAGVGATFELREGFGPAEICAAAAETASTLIVIGAHGWGALKRLLFGSVSTQVMHDAHCPVLVVRADEWAVEQPATSMAAARVRT